MYKFLAGEKGPVLSINMCRFRNVAALFIVCSSVLNRKLNLKYCMCILRKHYINVTSGNENA